MQNLSAFEAETETQFIHQCKSPTRQYGKDKFITTTAGKDGNLGSFLPNAPLPNTGTQALTWNRGETRRTVMGTRNKRPEGKFRSEFSKSEEKEMFSHDNHQTHRKHIWERCGHHGSKKRNYQEIKTAQKQKKDANWRERNNKKKNEVNERPGQRDNQEAGSKDDLKRQIL